MGEEQPKNPLRWPRIFGEGSRSGTGKDTTDQVSHGEDEHALELGVGGPGFTSFSGGEHAGV